MWPQWTSMLSPWQWAAIGALPLAIVALYFLKLKRQPLVVPSTYLWLRTIEDLHVNSLWQRLRRSLLLWLQLALLAALLIALARPHWESTTLTGGRHVFLVDHSASMAATDVTPTRLDEAKRRVRELIDALPMGDGAMIIAFSDVARVVQPYTTSRAELRRAVDSIEQTERRTSLEEALRIASGLIQAGDSTSVAARLHVLSDGNFAAIKEAPIGDVEATYVPIGTPEARNVGIVAFSAAASDEHPDHRQAFARIENFGGVTEAREATLRLDGELVDAQRVELPSRTGRGVAFDLGDIDVGSLELRLESPAGGGDALALDDRAWVVLDMPRRARVLLVSDEDGPLERALRTPRVERRAIVQFETTAFLRTKEYAALATSGTMDLMIFERCAPAEAPRANAWLIGRLPPGDAWRAEQSVAAPHLIDVNLSHPLMHGVGMDNVLVAEATPLVPPPAATRLLESNAGVLIATAPRESIEDVVQGFELSSADGLGTNWPLRLSFPVFVLNLLDYFGGDARSEARAAGPGDVIFLNPETGKDRLVVRAPSGKSREMPRGADRTFHFDETDRLGVYAVELENQDRTGFAVNLFDSQESRIAVRTDRGIQIGPREIAGQTQWAGPPRDGWKALVLAGLAILLLEWYIFNRRTFV